MGRPRCSATVLAVPVVCLTLAGCGTRLNQSAFTTTPDSAVQAAEQPTPTDMITLGLIVSKTSPLGEETFSGPMYGAEAYVNALNAAGGLAGRHVELDVCDDGATGAGNTKCVRKLIDEDKVFAFVGNSIFNAGHSSAAGWCQEGRREQLLRPDLPRRDGPNPRLLAVV